MNSIRGVNGYIIISTIYKLLKGGSMYDLDSEIQEIDEYWDRDAYDDFIASLDMND